MHGLWNHLHSSVRREGRAVLITVCAVQGSAPREAGARMIVTTQALRGTIGGGALEYEAVQQALALLREDHPQARVFDRLLGPDLGQCCGGRLSLGLEMFATDDLALLDDFARREKQGLVTRALFGEGPHAVRTIIAAPADGAALVIEDRNRFVERFCDQRTPLFLFGAGHVGTALVMALAPLPFHVRWFDTREESFPRLAPDNAEMHRLDDPASVVFPDGALVLIMTHSHPLDLALVAAALRSPAGFIGLIGSATKKARFHSQLRAAGFSAPELQRVTCPIGIAGIASKEPASIAASVAAQMLAERERARLEQRPGRPHHARMVMGAA